MVCDPGARPADSVHRHAHLVRRRSARRHNRDRDGVSFAPRASGHDDRLSPHRTSNSRGRGQHHLCAGASHGNPPLPPVKDPGRAGGVNGYEGLVDTRVN